MSLVKTLNHFVNECPTCNFLPSFLLHRSSLEVRVQLFHLGLIISTLEIALANIFRDVPVLLDEADVHQCNKINFPCLLLCAFFTTSFHSFHSIVAFASGINVAWGKIFCLCQCFPKHASLKDRSSESSAPYVTLHFRSSLNRTTFGVRTSCFPRFSHESILYSLDFKVYLKILVSQMRCAARRDNMCLLSPSESLS